MNCTDSYNASKNNKSKERKEIENLTTDNKKKTTELEENAEKLKNLVINVNIYIYTSSIAGTRNPFVGSVEVSTAIFTGGSSSSFTLMTSTSFAGAMETL